MEEFVGAVVLEVNGREVEISDLSVTEKTGKTPVKGMTRTGVVAGWARGIAEYALSFTTHIPLSAAPVDWSEITDARLVVYPIGRKGTRTAYTGVCVSDVEQEYKTDGEATCKISAFAQDKRIE